MKLFFVDRCMFNYSRTIKFSFFFASVLALFILFFIELVPSGHAQKIEDVEIL